MGADVIQMPTTFANSPLDGDLTAFTKDIERRSKNKAVLVKWIAENFHKDIDYGRPMGKKDSLYKPGSEKIINLLGLTAIFPSLKDYEDKVIRGELVDFILITCKLVTNKGDVVAEGGGARSVKAERGDLNKALKMALKSAQIDATLRVAGLSDMYTQDIEDMPKDAFENNGSKKELVWSEVSRENLVGFGKNKDIAWKDVDLGFLQWFINKEDADEDVKKFCLAEKVHRASTEQKKQAIQDEINEGGGSEEPKRLSEQSEKQIELMKQHPDLSITFVNKVNEWLYSKTSVPQQDRADNCIAKMVEQGVPEDYDPQAKDDDELPTDGIFGEAFGTLKKANENADKKDPPKAYNFDVKGMIQCAVDEWGKSQPEAVTLLIQNTPKKIKGNHQVIDKFDETQCKAVIEGIMDGTIVPF